MILLLAQPSPSPSAVAIDPSKAGSPGFLGFVFTFLVAIAAVFLFLSLTKQMRRVERRSQQLGLDEQDGGDGPHPDLGMIGAGGPDPEVDADVPVAFDVPDDDGPSRP